MTSTRISLSSMKRRCMLLTVAAAAAAVLGVFLLHRAHAGKALPGVSVAGRDVGGFTRSEVATALRRFDRPRTLTVKAAATSWSITTASVGVSLDLDATVSRVMAIGRRGAPDVWADVSALWRERRVQPVYRVDRDTLGSTVDRIAGDIGVAPVPGTLRIAGTTVTAVPPRAGTALDRSSARSRLIAAAKRPSSRPVELTITTQAPRVSMRQVEDAAARARAYLAEGLRLTIGDRVLTVPPNRLGELLTLTTTTGEASLAEDPHEVEHLVGELAKQVDKPAVDAAIGTPPATPVLDAKGDTAFAPRPARVAVVRSGTAGRALDQKEAKATIADLVRRGLHAATLPVRRLSRRSMRSLRRGCGI